VICQFIDARRARFGVAPICRALSAHGVPIAPRTYWAHGSRPPSRRALWDMTVTEILAGIYEPDERGRRRPESLYGSLKMWAYLQRQGVPVARCTIERLMRANGWRGASRARTARTTMPRPGDQRAPDLVNRQFTASRPDQLHVAGFTYVPLDGGGFGYTALVTGAFAGLITGWECSLPEETAFVERAIRQAAARRRREGRPLRGDTIHHSDAGSQLGFKGSSQHCLGELIVGTRRGLRLGFSIRAFCGDGC
jgi:putative transposase